MFARFTRLPLRRCVHTAAFSQSSHGGRRFATAALGASAVTAAYFSWRMSSDHNRIALDSPTKFQPVEHSPPKSPKPSSSSIPPPAEPQPPFVADPIPLADGENSLSPETPTAADIPDTHTPKDGEAAQEGEASQEGGTGGAFNPVTGEINWDCPCLGGMAHGPCGPEFREAFSCFIFSEDEPKGINCVEKFQAMQTCFRAHPEVYSDEIMDDDEEAAPVPDAESAVVADTAGKDSAPAFDTATEAAPLPQPPKSSDSASA
ncbi:hypothetical protein BDQ12DRAFT_730805 [Crucibulum laeve]|uniref:Mitochondrial intermembrane space import and assembly protein 40 n=1 Tax=Crucibulum laeve TaxID=68775 RepID=A0A5C3MHD3_9AGAR|nr:hypothetical protein BDQ12DRAFT_730805 [Crucibulum laeve]